MTNETTDNALPEWVLKRQREKAEHDREAEETTQKQWAASKSVQEGGPEFWARFADRLGQNVKALAALPEDELVGSLSPNNSGRELGFHLQVNRQSVKLGSELSKMNLWYEPGGYRIRRWYQDREMDDIKLASGPEGVVAVMGSNHPMTAENLGDHILRSMAEQVRA